MNDIDEQTLALVLAYRLAIEMERVATANVFAAKATCQAAEEASLTARGYVARARRDLERHFWGPV